MDEAESLSHFKWECKYHVIFIPKCRRRTLYEQLRRHLGEVFRELARHRKSGLDHNSGQYPARALGLPAVPLLKSVCYTRAPVSIRYTSPLSIKG